MQEDLIYTINSAEPKIGSLIKTNNGDYKMINFENVMADFNGPESEELNLCELNWDGPNNGNDRRNMIAFEDQE